MNYAIRSIQQSDNRELAHVIREIFREFKIDRPGTVYTDPTTDALYELFQAFGSHYNVVVSHEGKILGGCGIYPTPELPEGCAELVKFYLCKAARGKGIGFELLQSTMALAKKSGYTSLYLESLPELGKAVSLYEKLGFKRIDCRMGNSGHYSCTLWMLAEL